MGDLSTFRVDASKAGMIFSHFFPQFCVNLSKVKKVKKIPTQHCFFFDLVNECSLKKYYMYIFEVFIGVLTKVPLALLPKLSKRGMIEGKMHFY